MPRVAIDVLLKHEILDPQGRAVERALPGLGYDGISDVRVGKHLELDVDAAEDELPALIDKLCADFLTNPVIESFTWRVITDAERADAER
jgi:phosphoribosylformylglycinamidine synthase subunit PurS